MARRKSNLAEDTGIEITVTDPEDGEAERMAEAIQIAAETLTGDLRDMILDLLRHEQAKRPWNERPEADQRATIHAVESRVRDAAQAAVETIASHGRTVVHAHIEQAVVKDGIKVVLTCGRSDRNRFPLIDAVGSRIMLVLTDPEEFDGEREPVEVPPDQPELDVAVVHSDTDTARSPFH